MLHPNTVTISHLTAWIVLLSVTWHVHQLVLKVGNETWACVARLGQQGTQRLGTTFFFFFQFPLCFLAWASACHFIQCWWFLMMESDSIPIPQLPDSYCAKADRKTRGLEQLCSCAIALGQQVVFVCVCVVGHVPTCGDAVGCLQVSWGACLLARFWKVKTEVG